MEGRTRTSPEQDRVLAQGRSIGEYQRLQSDIYLSLTFGILLRQQNLSSRELNCVKL